MIKALLITLSLWTVGIGQGPSDEMFANLLNAPSAAEAADAAADISAAWNDSGSATVDIMMERGIGAQQSGDLETARKFFDRAIKIKPDYAEGWNRRASVFLTQENWTEALRDLNETLKLEPRHFKAWAGLGMMFEAVGANDEALVAHRKALEFYPGMPQAAGAVKRLSKELEGQDI